MLCLGFEEIVLFFAVCVCLLLAGTKMKTMLGMLEQLYLVLKIILSPLVYSYYD